MILGAEIGILLYGIYAMLAGKYSIGKGRSVMGGKARILGFICILPLPLAFVAGFILGLFYALVLNQPASPVVATFTEITILVVIIIIVSLLGKKFYNDQQEESLNQNYLP